MGRFSLQEPSEWRRAYFIPVSNFTLFQPRNLGLKVFSMQLGMKTENYEGGMLIKVQNDIFCGHSVVNYSV